MRELYENYNRIVHINTNDIRGGAAKFVWRLWNSQKNDGLDSKIIVGVKESDSPDVIQFPVKMDVKSHKECFEKGLLYYNLKGSHKLIEYPAIIETDLIHLHNLHGGYFNPFSLSGLSCIKPSVWTMHDMYPLTGHCAFSFDCNRWEIGCGDCPYLEIYCPINYDSTVDLFKHKKLIYDYSILNIVTPTKWMEKKVGRSILKDHRVQTIYHGIDTNIYTINDKMSTRKKYGIPNDRIIIGTVAYGGAFGDPRKGGHYVKKCIEALEKSGIDYAFINIGSEVIRETNPKIINMGYVEGEIKMAELYSTLDIFLFPSLAESFGLVVVEALSCGVPVIAFNCGAINEIVTDGENGFLVDYKDEQKLINATIELAANESLRKRFASSARITACERFDFDRMVKEYYMLYQNCIKDFNKYDKKSRVFPLDMIPEIIKCSEFHNLEAVKKGEFKDIISKKKPQNVSIIYNPNSSSEYMHSLTYVSILNQTYKNFSLKIGSLKEVNPEKLKGDLIYYIDDGYVLEPNFLEEIMRQYEDEDVICCMIELYRERGTSFYRGALPDIYFKDDIYQINSHKHNCMIFKRDIFIENSMKIIAQEYFPINTFDLINFRLVKTSLSAYIDDITKSLAGKRVFIYGAGGHTADLLKNSNLEKINICGIIDRDPEIENTTINGITVYNTSKIDKLDIDYIIISSAMYEMEIFETLRKTYKEDKLIRIYGGYL